MLPVIIVVFLWVTQGDQKTWHWDLSPEKKDGNKHSRRNPLVHVFQPFTKGKVCSKNLFSAKGIWIPSGVYLSVFWKQEKITGGIIIKDNWRYHYSR